eukprot:860357-Rhodomonas_salina.1
MGQRALPAGPRAPGGRCALADPARLKEQPQHVSAGSPEIAAAAAAALPEMAAAGIQAAQQHVRACTNRRNNSTSTTSNQQNTQQRKPALPSL